MIIKAERQRTNGPMMIKQNRISNSQQQFLTFDFQMPPASATTRFQPSTAEGLGPQQQPRSYGRVDGQGEESQRRGDKQHHCRVPVRRINFTPALAA